MWRLRWYWRRLPWHPQRRAAQRYERVMRQPPRPGMRERAEREVAEGARPVIHLGHGPDGEVTLTPVYHGDS